VRVLYVAPRATATNMNGPAVRALMEENGAAMDAPAEVARRIVAAMDGDSGEVTIGWPERLFLRANALLPRVVDKALRKQARGASRLLKEPR
jgi:short-subunit dehydrogenase